MGPQLFAVLGCLCVMVTRGYSAAVPTTETLVVTKVDDAFTGAPIESSSKPDATVADPTTEEPNVPIKLTEMDVRSEVAMRYAHTAVVTHVRNPAKRAQEATFRVLLPETAFISGFTMILDGKSYKAYVKEKEEAKQIYSDAVSQGFGAAHIAAKARDSNHFTVSVNVEPNTVAVFNLTYEELLVRRNKVYNHAINLHPGALVPKLTVTVHIKEAQKITALRVPEVRTGNEVDASENDAQNSKAVIERGHDDREATITFKPDLEEQKRLREIYAEKAKESQRSSRWNAFNDEQESQPEGVLGQFVVQYDVDRPEAGEILVNDGYFVHFFAPSTLPPLNKHVVFVLDTSGSMMDRKIIQLRQAMQSILSELNAGDYFSIVEFASSVQVHDLKEADEEPKPQSSNYNYYWGETKPATLVPPSPATPENVAKAKLIVSRLTANGGTNIASALDVAVDLIQKGIGWKQAPTTAAAPTTPASEDTSKDLPKAEEQKATTASEAPKDTDVTTPKSDEPKKDAAKQLEPIIIFLTDGDPTVGETNPTRIMNRLTEKNSGPNKASIFSLAFGEDADRKFLRKLSLRNEGFMRHIYEAADAALQLRDFYRQVSSPLLADVKFVYPPEQIKEGSLTKHKFRAFYAGSETVVAGRVADAGVELSPKIIGICGVRDDDSRKPYEIVPPVVRTTDQYLPLERLWAYLTIKQLLDERDAAEDLEVSQADKDKENTPEKKALTIALKYEFVTPLTSLVVVKPNATSAVDAESVDKPESDRWNTVGLSAPGLPGPPPGAGYFNALAAPQFAYKAAFSSAIGHVQAILPPQPVYDSVAYEESEDADFITLLASSGGSYRTAALSSSNYRSSPGSGTMFAMSSAPLYMTASYQPVMQAQIIRRQPPQFAAAYAGGIPGASAAWSPLIVGGSNRLGGGGYGSASAHRYGGWGGYGTSVPSTPAPPTSSTPAPAQDPLDVYHVREYPWVLTLRVQDTDSIELSGNETVKLELSKDDVAPKEASGDAECAHATDGAVGVCVYLTRCDAARTITPVEYKQSYCLVNNKYAGVCCPRTKVDLPKH